MQLAINYPVQLDTACVPTDRTCTWSIGSSGAIVNDFTPDGVSPPSLGLNAWGGASNPSVYLAVTPWCDASNPDCTWSLYPHSVNVDNYPEEPISYSGFGFDTSLRLYCSGPYCFGNRNDFALTAAAD